MSAELIAGLASAGVIVAIVVVVTLLSRGSVLLDVEMRFSSPLSPAQLREEALDDLLGLMAREEYALASVAGEELTFIKRQHPRWTFYVAALTWPFGPLLWIVGLLVLRRRRTVSLAVRAVAGEGGGSAIVAEGTVTRRLQEALRGFFGPS